MLWLLAALAVAALDCGIKRYLASKDGKAEQREYFGGRVRIRLLRNYGFAMGVGQKRPDVVKTATAAVNLAAVAGLCREILRRGSVWRKLSLSLIVGGGLSNLTDRVRRGFVTDYVSFRTRWKRLSGVVFNLSDLCIIGGVLLCAAGECLTELRGLIRS